MKDKNMKKAHIIYRKLGLLVVLTFIQMYSFAQTQISTRSTVFTAFKQFLPYVNGLVTILVFIGGIRGIQKLLRSDHEGKTDLMYTGLGAAAYIGLLGAIELFG